MTDGVTSAIHRWPRSDRTGSGKDPDEDQGADWNRRFAHGPDAHPRYWVSVKFTVTVMATSTGAPFNSVGSYIHCHTASTAA